MNFQVLVYTGREIGEKVLIKKYRESKDKKLPLQKFYSSDI